MKDEPDPPRKHYTFKESEFVRVNKPLEAPPGAGTDPNDQPINLQDIYRAANAGPVKKPAPVVENEVHAMLRENHAKAQAAGLNALREIPPRKSKRKRDYWLLFFAVNPPLVYSLTFNPVFAGAGLVLFNIGLAWTMWVVMDDY